MTHLTKRELVLRISKETGLIRRDVLRVIQRMLDNLIESLSRGQNVELRNFGVFKVAHRKAGVGRNPNRPERDMQIPPCPVVKFKAGKHTKAKVMKLSQTMAHSVPGNSFKAGDKVRASRYQSGGHGLAQVELVTRKL